MWVKHALMNAVGRKPQNLHFMYYFPFYKFYQGFMFDVTPEHFEGSAGISANEHHDFF